MKRLILTLISLVAILALTACGGATTYKPNHTIYVKGHPGLIDGQYAGFTYVGPDRTDILISDTLVTEDQRILVIMHELWHAVGHQNYHNDNPRCITAAGVIDVLPTDPCPEEVEQMKAVTGTFTVIVEDDWLRWAAFAAGAEWNAHIRRELFIVRD